MKEVIIKNNNGKYKIPFMIRYRLHNKKFFLEYNNNLYDKELSVNKEVLQMSLFVEALNIKNKKERLRFVYIKSCELLDNDFYGKNICKFNCNKCIHDRKKEGAYNGCCASDDGKLFCPHFGNNGCTIKCLACKFHICSDLKKEGYKFRPNDILMIKYLYNPFQKLFIYNDFFMTEEEVLNDVFKCNILSWILKPEVKWVKKK